jgi:hypothetical protein
MFSLAFVPFLALFGGGEVMALRPDDCRGLPQAIACWQVDVDKLLLDSLRQGDVVDLGLPEPWGREAELRGRRMAGLGVEVLELYLPALSEPRVLLYHKDSKLSALFYNGSQAFLLEPFSGGNRLLQLRDDGFPACGGTLPALQAERGEYPLLDDGSRIDVMVVYTPQARAAAGGSAAMEVTIQNAVDATNEAYANSQILPRLHLVHAAEVAHGDAGNLSSDLSWVASDAGVAALRDLHRADMVSLLVEDGAGFCGMGYVQRNPGPGFSGSAFQVTARGCAVGNLSFAHEFGHNQGCEHNPENTSAWPSGASYPWSFGHYHNGSYRTVMSYSAPCTSGCPRHPYFSNAAVLHLGLPTGVTDQRENYRTINETAIYVANFRQGCAAHDWQDWPATNVAAFVSALNAGCL